MMRTIKSEFIQPGADGLQRLFLFPQPGLKADKAWRGVGALAAESLLTCTCEGTERASQGQQEQQLSVHGDQDASQHAVAHSHTHSDTHTPSAR